MIALAFLALAFLCLYNQKGSTNPDILNDLDSVQEGPLLFQSTNSSNKSCVAIIVPYRNRALQLYQFLDFMPSFLERKNDLQFRIYIVNQTDDHPFNRGMLINVGFREAEKDFPWSCVIFHDVDLLPQNETNTYRCSKNPLMMASRIDKFSWKLPYEGLFGGVGMMTSKQYTQINGFSNMYWGWGAEDDDVYRRLRSHRFP